MTKKAFRKHRFTMEEWANGKKIEFYDKYLDKWVVTENPRWDALVEYRVHVFIPKQGELIEVFDGFDWAKRTFVEMDGDCYMVISGMLGRWSVNVNGYLITSSFEDARPINND